MYRLYLSAAERLIYERKREKKANKTIQMICGSVDLVKIPEKQLTTR